MNIQRLKKSTNALFLFLGLLLFSSCDAQDKTTVMEILTGKEVGNAGYIYSDDSIFKLGNKEYSLRSKAIYDADGNIQQLVVYKSEGKLNYNRNDLLGDKKLLDYYELPFQQKMSYSDGKLMDKNNKIAVTYIEDYLINKDDGVVRFYKLK